MAEHNIIGITQYVQLPDYSLDDIPAKIDTGADGSAIWASSISERDGKLFFTLFAPQSVFYTGEVYTTSKYSVANVKNSFGKSEYRYKVKLKLKIANNTYKTSFNLADRSHSGFPVLIGKRFLRSRFVVDAAQDNITTANYKDCPIVVLKSVINKSTRDLFDLVSKKVSSEIILECYKSLRFEINENCEPKILLRDGRDIANAKIVYFKSHNLYPEHASAVVKYLQYKHTPFIDKELDGVVSHSKLSELFILATNGLSVPKTKIFTGHKNVPSYDELKLILGDTFVIKDALSDRGKNNFLVNSVSSYDRVMRRLTDTKVFIIQQFIENDGFLRVLIMGEEIVQMVKRYTAVHSDPLKSHLNKPHGGANAYELTTDEYSSDVVVLARKAALAMRRNVVGIDLIQDITTKKWYVLEANNNPEVVGGINASKKAEGLARLLESKNE